MLARLMVPIVLVIALAVLVAVGNSSSSPPATAQDRLSPVANIQLRGGPNPGEVVVSWDVVPQATYYRIGYVNMAEDYPLAKASVTGEWISAFIYVDVNTRGLHGFRRAYGVHGASTVAGRAPRLYGVEQQQLRQHGGERGRRVLLAAEPALEVFHNSRAGQRRPGCRVHGYADTHAQTNGHATAHDDT